MGSITPEYIQRLTLRYPNAQELTWELTQLALAEQGWSLPNIYASESYGRARFGEWLPHFAALHEQAYTKTPDPYSTVATRDGHTINGFVFTQHESPEEQASQQKLGEAREWMNLLSLGHDNKVGFCFWDAGTVTFSVHKKDLAIADFDNVVATLESS